MNLKRILAFLAIFCLGIGLGAALTYHPSPPIPPAIYKSEVYFSPNGSVASHIIKAVNESISSIDLAIFDLTSDDIASSLEKAQKRGVKIRIIADSRQAKGAHSVIQSLIDEGLNIKIVHGIGRGIMHNKFAIFDKKLLVTGSYNWTNNAEHFNYENAVFISDPEIINQYQKEFDNIYNSASM
jgi:phosphatidylserine/phosphatidylglycerophosphate/cardiolipin synthase-like enzyme